MLNNKQNSTSPYLNQFVVFTLENVTVSSCLFESIEQDGEKEDESPLKLSRELFGAKRGKSEYSDKDDDPFNIEKKKRNKAIG